MDILSLRPPLTSRRDFLKLAGASLALLGLSQTLTPRVVKALESTSGKPAVIWIEGQDCAGCTESFLNNLEPSAVSILLDTISLRYHETAMTASGYLAEQARQETIAEGGYVLVIEGSIPLADDGLYCTVGGKTFRDIVAETAKNAAVIICAGACSSFGGIPGAGPTDAVGYLFRSTKKHHYFDDIVGEKPVINLPTCPLHNERLVAVIVHYLTFGTVPPLDDFNRPLAFYAPRMHDNCERRGNFDAGRFLTDWGDPSQKGWCLYLKGCRGPWSNHDCWKRQWNTRTSYCIASNTPCIGCSEPEFYQTFSPLYNHSYEVGLPGIGRVDIDKILVTLAGITAAGVGIDMLVSRMQSSGGKES